MAGIEGIGINNFAQTQNINPQAQTQSIGSFAGMSVQVEDDSLSKLMDSAEELTFARDNSKQTKLADRKQKTSSSNMAERIEQFRKVMESLEHNDAHMHQQLMSKWSETKANHEQIKNDIENSGGHCSSNYAALLSLAESCEDASLQQELKAAADLIFKENKSAIVAAMNTIEVAASNQGLAPAVELSNAYSEVTNELRTPQAIVKYINEKFGADKIDAAIDFLFKALGADLKAAVKSQEQAVLENIGTSLTRAKEINSANLICNDLIDRLHKVHDINISNISGFNVLDRLIDLSQQRFIYSDNIRNVFKGIPPQDVEKEVLMAQELMLTLRTLNSDIFTDNDNYSKLYDATQKHIDECVTKEDEYLAGL